MEDSSKARFTVAVLDLFKHFSRRGKMNLFFVRLAVRVRRFFLFLFLFLFLILAVRDVMFVARMLSLINFLFVFVRVLFMSAMRRFFLVNFLIL